MTATILDGKATRAAIFDDLRVRVAALAERGIVPGLGTILVGDDPGSHSYVRGKHNACAKVGINSIRRDLPDLTVNGAPIRPMLALQAVAPGVFDRISQRVGPSEMFEREAERR